MVVCFSSSSSCLLFFALNTSEKCSSHPSLCLLKVFQFKVHVSQFKGRASYVLFTESLFLLHFSLHSGMHLQRLEHGLGSFPSVWPPKVKLIPDGGVGANSGHANNDVKPCIGTFEIKTPSRRNERQPISGTKAGVEFQSAKSKSTPPRHDGTYSTAAGTTERPSGCARSTINLKSADVQNSASSPAPACTAIAALRIRGICQSHE